MIRLLPLALVLGCGSAEPDGFEAGITYDDVLPVFETWCGSCHLGTSSPRGDLSLDRAEDIVEVTHDGTGMVFVAPGSLEDSYLWHKLMDTHLEQDGGDGNVMPPAGDIPVEELAIVRSWILGGAAAGSAGGFERCEEPIEACAGDCVAGPGSVTHPAWHNRLTETPELAWEPVSNAISYEIAVRNADGDDVHCWTDVGATTQASVRAIWVLEDAETYTAHVRAVFADDTRSEATDSPGWTVDILPPEAPSAPEDARVPVDGVLTWVHDLADNASGFVGFEVGVGSAPGDVDILPYQEVGRDTWASIATEVAGLPETAWYWVAIRAVDVAGNRSQPALSEGFIMCPAHHVFVPGDEVLGTTPFCLATYEMRILGTDDGLAPTTGLDLPESRPNGTPWAFASKSAARAACDLLGDGYQLITNQQWQTVARSIERTDANWSGGLVGAGAVNTGHSDEDPFLALASDGSPCVGTNNPSCEDPGHPDFGQKRTHVLDNGAVIWDLAGNLGEQVDGSTGGPPGLWQSFDGSAFTTDVGWEDFRRAFAPAGDFTHAQGMGRMYGGSGNLSRGGAFDASNPGTAGSSGTADTGIFQAHHNTWSTGETNGFRCAYTPM